MAHVTGKGSRSSPAAKGSGGIRVTRSISNEIKPAGSFRDTESVRLPRNISGQNRKPLGNRMYR